MVIPPPLVATEQYSPTKMPSWNNYYHLYRKLRQQWSNNVFDTVPDLGATTKLPHLLGQRVCYC